MKINLTIVDVNVSSVEATLDYIANKPNTFVTGKVISVSGKATLILPDDVWTVAVSIIPIDHNNDLVRVRKVEGSSEWQIDNPACRINQSGNDLSIDVMVGRLRSAPTVYIPDQQIPKIAGNPSGVLLKKDNQGLIYHSLFADSYKPFFRLDHPIFEPKIKENASEWDRLRYVSRDEIDPNKSGVFFHLEYGAVQNGPRLFLSLYLPSPGKRNALDYVVFFSPSTAIPNRFPIDKPPFRGNYPYGMTAKTDQSYPRHSQGYLFNGAHLVHQLLAAESNAVIVMPLAPYGDWSVFQTRAGLYRLLLECNLFLHREYFTTQHALVRPSWPEYARAGGSVHLPTGMGAGVASSIFGRFEPVPPIDRVAVAAFSDGCKALQKLLIDTAGKLPKEYNYERFGANVSAFEGVFKEVWDIDGAHPAYHGYEAFEKALSAWYKQGNRRFRLYHTSNGSEATGGERDSMSYEALKPLRKPSDIVNEVSVTKNGASYWAKERHAADRQWSCVRFEYGFLSSDNPSNKARPYWMKDDAHHFVPKIAFGHAAHLFSHP